MVGKIEEGREAHFEFPTAMIYALSHDDRYMAPVVGFAMPNEQCTGAMRHGLESRPGQTISFSPEPSYRGFSSRGKLSGIVGIIAYSKSDPPEGLCGIALAYRDESPVILGQAHKRCGTSQKQGADNVREVFVYYKRSVFGRRVSGLRFFCWSSYNITFGNCSHSNFEILRPSPVSIS